MGSVEGCFELGGRGVAAVAVKAVIVVPVDPAEGGELDVLDRLPGPRAGGASDELGLVVAVDGLREGVDAPIGQDFVGTASGLMA